MLLSVYSRKIIALRSLPSELLYQPIFIFTEDHVCFLINLKVKSNEHFKKRSHYRALFLLTTLITYFEAT